MDGPSSDPSVAHLNSQTTSQSSQPPSTPSSSSSQPASSRPASNSLTPMNMSESHEYESVHVPSSDVEAGVESKFADVELPNNPNENRFPYALVWGALPLITWILPFIGHMGIADSQGRIHDFQGPYHVVRDRFMVGSVKKYYRISTSTPIKQKPGQTRRAAWDEAVRDADSCYRDQMHNICCNNCHHHAADALTRMGLPTTMFQAWVLITFKGRYVSWSAILWTYLPFLILSGIVLGAVLLSKASNGTL